MVTETDSALRECSHFTRTVVLVCRKRQGAHKTSRGDLAWEILEEVEKQAHDLTGLNQQAKGHYRDENVIEDADIEMAGYAATLRVLTRYRTIEGRDMTSEAIRPRVRGENLGGAKVLAHLAINIPDYYANQEQRDRVVEFAAYLADRLATQRPEEASAARVLRDLVRNQRLG